MKQPIFPILLACGLTAAAEPRIDSWRTADSARYARIYETYADEQSGNAVTTWDNGTYAQAVPAYAGVQQIHSDATYVYITTTGLAAGHVMGPWYNDTGPGGSLEVFQNWPEAIRTIYRIPLQPTIPATKTTYPLGAIGLMVDGTIIFSESDSFSWDNAQNGTGNGTDTGPGPGSTGRGDGLWLHDAFLTEGNTFDKSNAHSAGNQLHYHASPMKLRNLMGDSVDAVAQPDGSFLYQENFNGGHSPILGWLADGIPLYGPYGYGDAMDPDSTVRRMVSGFILRNGQNGSFDTAANGRTTLPAWAARYRNRSTACSINEQGPTAASYAVPYFMEDYDYLGDLTNPADGQPYELGVDYDLNESNCRYCVTPEFPEGTWAYFVCVGADGKPAFPYNVGAQYYGDPSAGGAVGSLPQGVTGHFTGGPDIVEESAAVEVSDGMVTVTWNVAEGGSYTIQDSGDLGEWNVPEEDTTADWNTLSIQENVGSGPRFFRIRRSGLAPYHDGNGVVGGGTGGEVSFTFTFGATPPMPPQNVISSASVDGQTAVITAYDQTGRTATLRFDDSSFASGTSHAAALGFTTPNGTAMTLNSTNQYTKP